MTLGYKVVSHADVEALNEERNLVEDGSSNCTGACIRLYTDSGHVGDYAGQVTPVSTEQVHDDATDAMDTEDQVTGLCI